MSLPKLSLSDKEFLITNIKKGDFSLISKSKLYELIRDAYKAVHMTKGGLDLIINEEPPSNKGFTFWEHPILGNIQANMKFINLYSGVTIASILRKVQYIERRGWKYYVLDSLNDIYSNNRVEYSEIISDYLKP
jgi:hypothetical protein